MTIADAPSRPVIRYHGGKWRLAPWIIAQFPPHRVYVEPYGGAGSVLLRKPRARGEVYNDLWGRVVDVFRVLRDPDMAHELQRRLILTPFARSEFAAVTPAAFETDDIVERARMTIVRAYQGHGSNSPDETQATGFRSNSMRSNTTPAVEWANYPWQIAAFVERLRGVVIEQRPAADVMRGFDGPDTLHYVDPPYVHETRSRGNPYCKKGYAHEMSDADHEALAAALGELEGMVVVSGYDCPLYRRLFGGWKRIECRALADGALERTEVLWMNEAATLAAVQPCMFSQLVEVA
jgi:DNA adenine methylase